MSVKKLRKLKDAWQGNDALQSRINAALDSIGFTEEYVSTSISAEKKLSRKSKQIKDNQWGMIEFDWRSIRLVDCPLIQRLRYVKQLGFTYLTYPSAEHSRFSHTLGVGHVVSKFIEAIDKRAAEARQLLETTGITFVSIAEIREIKPDDLIHAALLHDVGHLPFSHVTEKILESQPNLFTCGDSALGDVIFEVNRIISKNVKFAEILSLMLILSKRFETFYRDFVLVGEVDVEDALLRVASLIIGSPPSPSLTGVPELISSASVDADKVDYVNRDALNCGVPVGVDVARIFLRSGIVSATREQILEINLKPDPEALEYLFVVNSSGIDTIDEILQARTSLYQRVYFHAVTRTVERLLSISLAENASARRKDADLTDALKIWSKQDAIVLDRLVNSEIETVRRPAARILNRQFPKKAYSFSPAIADLQVPIVEVLPLADERSVAGITKQVNNTTIETHLRDEHLWKGSSKEIEAKIKEEASTIVDLLRAKGKSEFIPSATDEALLGSPLLVGTAHEKQKRHNQIISQNDRLLTLREYTNAREQQDAYELLKEVGYVLCDEDWRSINFFASRVVLAKLANQLIDVDLKFKRVDGKEPSAPERLKYITRFLPGYSLSVLRSGLSTRVVDRLAAVLFDCGYFDDKPWACEPENGADPKIIQIADKLRKFDGYRSWSVTSKSVAAFISQFPPSLREDMVRILLSDLTVVNTQTAVSTLAPMLSAVGQVDVVPFSPSSGAQIHTWLKKELGANDPDIVFHVELDAALNSGRSCPIVFVDDNSSTGIQACAQFLSFLGVSREDWPDESREEDSLYGPLSTELLAKFRERDVYLFVSAGRPEAEAAIKSCLEKFGMSRFAGVRFAQSLDGGIKWPPPLRRYLEDVGGQLIAWQRHSKSLEELTEAEQAACRLHAFGYNNAGGLLTTLLSVPTGTITPLWLPGLCRGQPWMPLVLRTNKLRHLIIG
jgi:deoxynucleoside triphosphate triphosphohydrolase SAMHD1